MSDAAEMGEHVRMDQSEVDDTVVWINGELVADELATVHWSDHGLTVGDGVFETIEIRDGRPFALSRHLQRLAHSAAGLGLSAPVEESVRQGIDEVCAAWGSAPGRLRVTFTAGPGPMGSDRGGAPPTLILSASPMVVTQEPTAVLTVPYRRNERGALSGLKTTSYAENVVALARAKQAGASEAIFANTVDHLCEGTGSNVFVVVDGRLVTPPLSSGCLAGITRELLLEALRDAGRPAVEQDLAFSVMDSVEEMFLVSTGRHLQPVHRVDGRRLLGGGPGSITEAARTVWLAAFSERIDP